MCATGSAFHTKGDVRTHPIVKPPVVEAVHQVGVEGVRRESTTHPRSNTWIFMSLFHLSVAEPILLYSHPVVVVSFARDKPDQARALIF